MNEMATFAREAAGRNGNAPNGAAGNPEPVRSLADEIASGMLGTMLDAGIFAQVEPVAKIEPGPIHAKLAAVMGAVTVANKGGTNTNDRYTYATEADVVEPVRAALADQSVMFYTTVEQIETGEIASSSGGKRRLTRVRVRFTFADEAQVIERIGYGYGLDYAEKGYAKALTAATKYFIAKTFLIATAGEDPDADPSNVDEAGNPVAAPFAWKWGKERGVSIDRVSDTSLAWLAGQSNYGTDDERAAAQEEINRRANAKKPRSRKPAEPKAAPAPKVEPQVDDEPAAEPEPVAEAPAEPVAPEPEPAPEPEAKPKAKRNPKPKPADTTSEPVDLEGEVTSETLLTLQRGLVNVGRAIDLDDAQKQLAPYIESGALTEGWAREQIAKARARHGARFDDGSE